MLPYFFIWSGRRVSNSRPQPWQGCALPTELLPHCIAFFITLNSTNCAHLQLNFSKFNKRTRAKFYLNMTKLSSSFYGDEIRFSRIGNWFDCQFTHNQN